MANGKPGAPTGNKNGVKEKRLITDALRRAVAQNPDKLRDACLKLLDMAVEGNPVAFREIADRLDGKPEAKISGNIDHDHKHEHTHTVKESIDFTAIREKREDKRVLN